jgi:hypothetical protein
VVIPRRVALLGLAALILAVAGVAAAATYSDDDDTPAALEQPVTTTTSSVPDTTTTLAVTSSTTTTTPATSTTISARTTTTRRGATTTSTRPGATTTTAPIAACTTDQLEVRVTTDKPSYGIGEPVKIHSTLRNRSATTCTYPSFVFGATILGPGGATITGFTRVGEAPGGLGAGQANEAFVTWERVACTSDICPANTPGQYTVSATWNAPGGPYTATTTINLT